MKRNRIVIDFDKLGAAPRKTQSSGGCVKVLLVIAVILLVVLGGITIGGYFWWRHYQSSPSYTLALLTDAAQANDQAAIASFLDDDKICADFVGQVRNHLPQTPSFSSLWPAAPLAPQAISGRLKETVHQQLVKEIQDLTEAAKGKPFIVVALAVPHFAEITQQDKTAQAAVTLKDQQIGLKMAGDGERWRIVAVQDDKLAKQVADSVVRSAPANANQFQDEIFRQLNKLNK
jgi:hypothetical protein